MLHNKSPHEVHEMITKCGGHVCRMYIRMFTSEFTERISIKCIICVYTTIL
jgi:hypothetical protein